MEAVVNMSMIHFSSKNQQEPTTAIFVASKKGVNTFGSFTKATYCHVANNNNKYLSFKSKQQAGDLALMMLAQLKKDSIVMAIHCMWFGALQAWFNSVLGICYAFGIERENQVDNTSWLSEFQIHHYFILLSRGTKSKVLRNNQFPVS